MGFYEDVHEQPMVLSRIVEAYGSVLKDRISRAADVLRNQTTLAVGMGSSLFAAEYFAQVASRLGFKVFAEEAGELLYYKMGLLGGSCLLAVSQSGESVETCRVAGSRPTSTAMVAVTNDEGSSLGRAADVVLPLFAGPESATSSKTYMATLAVLYLLGRELEGRLAEGLDDLTKASDAVRQVIAWGREESLRIIGKLGSFDSIVYTGRGPGLVTSLQSALITKEMGHIHAEGISAAQFRHGPIEVAGPHLPVVVFIPVGETSDLLWRLARQVSAFGSPTWVLTDDKKREGETVGLCITELPSLGERLFALASIVLPEFLAALIAERQGLTPGVLSRISKVTTEE